MPPAIHKARAMSPKLAIKSVTSVKQTDPASFEVRARLRDGSAARLILSTTALAKLVQQVEPLFRAAAGPDSALD